MSEIETKNVLIKKLARLVNSMDVPSFRKESPYWLSKNLSNRNSNHKNYEEAMAIIQQLLKMGVR